MIYKIWGMKAYSIVIEADSEEQAQQIALDKELELWTDDQELDLTIEELGEADA